jgi:uncharacterized protein
MAKTTRKKARILSLDGGGIRGIIPATVMEYVESELIKRSKNKNARIADYFDMVVGTSTGGILGCYYLTPNTAKVPLSRFVAREALEIYSKKGHEIFNDSKRSGWLGLRQLFNATRFSPDNLEKILKDTFGDLAFHDLLKPCIITSYNMEKGRALFFNSHETGQKKQERQYFVRDVVRSTSAAPTYFPPAKVKNLSTGEEMVNIDGGVFANNPVMCAYAEARKTHFSHLELINPGAKDMLILSLGTGSMPVDLKDPNNSGKWGVINWAKTAPEIMMDGGLDTVNHQIAQIFGSLKESKDRANLKRVNVPADLRFPKDNRNFKPPYNSDMSDASEKNIRDLQKAGKAALADANTKKDGQLTLDEFIDELIAIDQLIEPKIA